MSNNYRILDFPAPTKEIINEVLSLVSKFEQSQVKLTKMDEMSKFETPGETNDVINSTHKVVDTQTLGLPMDQLETVYPDVATLSYLPVSQKILKWIKSEVIDTDNVGIQVFHSGSFFFPHIDIMRKGAINCIIETGGKNVLTNWYEPKSEFSHLPQVPRTFVPYERISLIDHTQFKKGVWHTIDVSKIHNVTNIDPSKKRIALTISLDLYEAKK